MLRKRFFNVSAPRLFFLLKIAVHVCNKNEMLLVAWERPLSVAALALLVMSLVLSVVGERLLSLAAGPGLHPTGLLTSKNSGPLIYH